MSTSGASFRTCVGIVRSVQQIAIVVASGRIRLETAARCTSWSNVVGVKRKTSAS